MSIKTRLLFAVGVLTLSTIVVGLVSWYWLSRSNEIIEDLHNTTLAEVTRSHELTKQSSVFTTSAPLLLSLKSSYLLEAEGNKLLRSIDNTIELWETRKARTIESQQQYLSVVQALRDMRQSMVMFISETQGLSKNQDNMRSYISEVGELERELSSILSNNEDSKNIRSIWRTQAAANILITASSATSSLSLGEYQRRYEKLIQSDNKMLNSLVDINQALTTMRNISTGENGLFEIRYNSLEQNLTIRKALNEISTSAARLNESVLELINISEKEISARGQETRKNLHLTKIILFIFGIGSIAIALVSALYVSGYVVNNLNKVSKAMSELANDGAPEIHSPDINSKDEIGKLNSAFSVFQLNAIKFNRLHQQLLQKTALFESTFQNITDGVLILDRNSRVLAHNPQINQLLSNFGNEPKVKTGRFVSMLFKSISTDFDDNEGVDSISNYQEHKNQLGQVLEFRMNDLPDGGSVWLISDTTERKRVEERLQHFQRLESLGQLTGEVAHDVNNILSTVKIGLPLVASRRSDPIAHQSAIDKIEDAIDLGSSFTNRLLAFARKQKLEPKVIELNELIRGVSELIALSLGKRIQLDICLLEQEVFVKIDPLQLESALLNLCINSAHAIEDEGRVTIWLVLKDDNSVDITVKDNGKGMNADVLKRAIEPFYSTRKNGSGCGLGLSIVYGFMKQSGGDMHLFSTEGKGTKVVLNLKQFNKIV